MEVAYKVLYILETASLSPQFGLHLWPRPEGDFTSIGLVGYEHLAEELVDAKIPSGLSVKCLKRPVVFEQFCPECSVLGRGRKQKKPNLDKIPDFWTTDPLPTVSQAFKTLIESMDPGVHQFFPLKMYVYGSDTRVEQTQFYLFICGRFIDIPCYPRLPKQGTTDLPVGDESFLYVMRHVQERRDYQAYLATIPLWRNSHNRGTYFVNEALLKMAQQYPLKGFKETSKGVHRDVCHVFYPPE